MNIFKKLTDLEIEASNFGFKWDKAEQIITQIRSEVDEVVVHLHDQDQVKLQEEIGDLLHAVFSLCVFSQFDVEKTLENSVYKFERRFEAVKKLATEQGLTSLNGKSFDELMNFWDQVKKNNNERKK